MTVGASSLACCCASSPGYTSCGHHEDAGTDCDSTYIMSDFEFAVTFKMRHSQGGQDVVEQFVPQFVPEGCFPPSGPCGSFSGTRSYTPSGMKLLGCRLRHAGAGQSNPAGFCPRVESHWTPPAQTIRPFDGTTIVYDGINCVGNSYTYGADNDCQGTFLPMFRAFTRCNVPQFGPFAQACSTWQEPHPSVPNGKFEMLVLGFTGPGYVERCNPSNGQQSAGWTGRVSSDVPSASCSMAALGARVCKASCVFLYWREYQSDPTSESFVFTPGTFQFYGARVGMFDHLRPTYTPTAQCSPISLGCTTPVAETCCCCPARASPEDARRFYSTGTNAVCTPGIPNDSSAVYSVIPWNAALNESPPPGFADIEVPQEVTIA